MGKVRVEVCLISARGLKRSSFLWSHHHWFAVGWIDPKDKYCTKFDTSGSPNPVWKTKFSALVDDNSDRPEKGAAFQDLALQVEVYSRDPIFYTEKLQGRATISLREFLMRRARKEPGASSSVNGEVGSYQLRKKKSDKPRGFVDVSIRVLDEGQDSSFYTGDGGGVIMLLGNDNPIAMASDDNALAPPLSTGPTPLPLAAAHKQHSRPQPDLPYSHPTPFPMNYANPCVGGPSYPLAHGASYQSPFRAHPPALGPPSRAGYLPASLARPEYSDLRGYINMPSSSGGAVGRGGAVRSLGMGVGAGAAAAGAVMYGAGALSGFDVPTGFQDPSLTISLDPLF